MNNIKKNWKIVSIIVAGSLLVFLSGSWMYYSNAENSLRNLIMAKMDDNRNQFDLMWKQISQVAQVTKEERKTLTDLIVNNANSRGINSDKVVMAWVKEAVPNASNATYLNLQNIIVSARSSFARNQTELLSLAVTHKNLIQNSPSCFFIGGRKPIEIKIITSSKTENTFQSGKDDDVKVF